jgi:hypothetical protein
LVPTVNRARTPSISGSPHLSVGSRTVMPPGSLPASYRKEHVSMPGSEVHALVIRRMTLDLQHQIRAHDSAGPLHSGSRT